MGWVGKAQPRALSRGLTQTKSGDVASALRRFDSNPSTNFCRSFGATTDFSLAARRFQEAASKAAKGSNLKQ
jgi:hypothetical protein